MIGPELIRRLATLARLKLSDSEVETLSREAGSILDYAASLNVLDITEVPPMTHAEPVENVMRGDVAVPVDDATRGRLMEQLAEQKDDQLQVPNVFGNA